MTDFPQEFPELIRRTKEEKQKAKDEEQGTDNEQDLASPRPSTGGTPDVPKLQRVSPLTEDQLRFENERLSKEVVDLYAELGMYRTQHRMAPGAGSSSRGAGRASHGGDNNANVSPRSVGTVFDVNEAQVMKNIPNPFPQGFVGDPSIALAVMDFGFIHQGKQPVSVASLIPVFRAHADELDVEFSVYMTTVLSFFVVNGTSPNVRPDLLMIFPAKYNHDRSSSSVTLQLGEFLIRARAGNPTVTIRQILRCFADNARQLIRANPSLKPPMYLRGLARKPRPSVAQRELSFDFADSCSNLSDSELAYIEKLKAFNVNRSTTGSELEFGLGGSFDRD